MPKKKRRIGQSIGTEGQEEHTASEPMPVPATTRRVTRQATRLASSLNSDTGLDSSVVARELVHQEQPQQSQPQLLPPSQPSTAQRTRVRRGGNRVHKPASLIPPPPPAQVPQEIPYLWTGPQKVGKRWASMRTAIEEQYQLILLSYLNTHLIPDQTSVASQPTAHAPWQQESLQEARNSRTWSLNGETASYASFEAHARQHLLHLLPLRPDFSYFRSAFFGNDFMINVYTIAQRFIHGKSDYWTIIVLFTLQFLFECQEEPKVDMHTSPNYYAVFSSLNDRLLPTYPLQSDYGRIFRQLFQPQSRPVILSLGLALDEVSNVHTSQADRIERVLRANLEEFTTLWANLDPIRETLVPPYQARISAIHEMLGTELTEADHEALMAIVPSMRAVDMTLLNAHLQTVLRALAAASRPVPRVTMQQLEEEDGGASSLSEMAIGHMPSLPVT